MTTDKTVLDIIFLYVFSERYNLINEDLVYIASSEWEHVWKHVKPLKQEIYVDDSKITKFLFAVGNSLQSQSWNYAKRVGIEAESQYNKLRKLVPLTVIQPFLLKNNQESKQDATIPKINFHQPYQLGVLLMAPPKPEYLVSDVVNKKESGRDSTLTDHEIRSFDKESSMIVNQVTNLRDFCSPKEIVDELSSVFKKDWRAAFEHCRISNDKGDTIKFLRDILKVSYGMVCRPITEAQLILMQREALKIVSGSNRVTSEFPDRTILEDYRRQYASLSLRYVKENDMHHQDEELQWSIETFFYYLVTDKFTMVPKIMELVNREYIKMIQRLTSDEKGGLLNLEAVLNDAHQQNWRQAKRNLDRARLQYQEVILPHWREEKEQHDRLQDLHLRAKAQVHLHQYQRKRVKTTKTANKDSSDPNATKKLSMKQRLFSKSRESNAENKGKESIKETSKDKDTSTISENGILPKLLPQSKNVNPKEERVDAICTRQLRRQHSLRQRVLNNSNMSDEVDSLSTRQSLLSGPLNLENHGENISYVNDSQKMDAKDPSIVDDTDTIAEKIAEAFDEIFNNEWQDAFKEIKNLQAGKQSPMKDREIIRCLREIVLKTYAYSKDESTRQVVLMERACVCIMSTGELKGAQEYKLKDSEYTEFLSEYRKHMADLSVTRVQNVFVFNYLDKILDKYSLKRVSKSAVVTYTKKCVELSWWMCVQCPPVFMLPGDEDGLFDNKLYKHYKKGGKYKVIEFIVWPALLSKEHGHVLSKGIAQG